MMMNKAKPFMMKNKDGEEDEEMMGDDSMEDGKAGKLLGLNNLLDAISEISDEDLRPHIEKMKSSIPMEPENGEEVEEKMPGGLEVQIGMGKPEKSPEMLGEEDNEEEDDDEDEPKSGFLAILSKRMKEKSKK